MSRICMWGELMICDVMMICFVYVCELSVCDLVVPTTGGSRLPNPRVVDDGIFDTTTPPPSGRGRRTRNTDKMVNIPLRQDHPRVVAMIV